jgi:hypothetical protein
LKLNTGSGGVHVIKVINKTILHQQ